MVENSTGPRNEPRSNRNTATSSGFAEACKITARYLHHLFTAESETVTQYIQRRRLEECARALVAAPVRGRLVTEIAFDYGFNSLTHFGRVFRHQFGLTPSEYRRTAREQV